MNGLGWNWTNSSETDGFRQTWTAQLGEYLVIIYGPKCLIVAGPKTKVGGPKRLTERVQNMKVDGPKQHKVENP